MSKDNADKTDGWFAGIDEESTDAKWRPFLRVGSLCLPINVWFDSEEECLAWIVDSVLGQDVIQDETETENNSGNS